MNIIEIDILRLVDKAYSSFQCENPSVEIVCDEQTMKQWYEFIKFCYFLTDKNSGEVLIDDLDLSIMKNPKDFDFEISDLMESAINECEGWWEKDNIDHQQAALEYIQNEKPLTEEPDYDYDNDPDDLSWHYYEKAFEKILESVDTSCFIKLSKISL